MTIDASEVSQMARMIAIMNGKPIVNEGSKTSVASVSAHPDPAIEAMKSILVAFKGASAEKSMGRVAETLVEDSESDRSLREAMITESVDDGARIGSWVIRMKKDGARKFYDVTGVNETTPIAADLTLYEAAYGIARALSENLPITSRMVRDILRAEEEYSAALVDAIHHKHSLSKRLDECRRPILEDRYEAAKARALVARHKIKELVRPLPFSDLDFH